MKKLNKVDFKKLCKDYALAQIYPKLISYNGVNRIYKFYSVTGKPKLENTIELDMTYL
jgi:hypothetical protein